MEEEKAAAYYEELTRKGEGAARFKQGLGFSSSPATNDGSAPPARGSYFVSATSSPSSSSFLGSFVRASSPSAASKFEKQAQLESIQNKLRKKPEKESADRYRDREARVSERSHRSRSRDRDRDRDRERHSRRRSRSRSRERYRDRDRDRGRDRKRRSRSRSSSPRRRSDKRRSVSPRDRVRSERSKSDGLMERSKIAKPRDYSQLIDGYDKMTPAEKVKAKMKLQLTETAEKDEANGMGSGWERFEFDKDAPLEDEDVEAAEDDAALVKHIGQSFRFSAVEARREEQIKTAHDEAMFGSSAQDPSLRTDMETEEDNIEETNNNNNDVPAASLLNEKVLARQQGSWRDRARKTT